MWKAIAATGVLLAIILGLTAMQRGRPGMAPADQLAFEREIGQRRQAVLQAGTRPAAGLACPAARASDLTVRTLYLVWISRRPDLTTQADRDDTARDLEQVMRGCGTDATAQEAAAHNQGLDVDEAVALSMLAAGR